MRFEWVDDCTANFHWLFVALFHRDSAIVNSQNPCSISESMRSGLLELSWNTPRPEGAGIIHASPTDTTEIVLLRLDVHLESWRFPIPTLFIILAAFSSRSCIVPQFTHCTDRTFKSNLPHLYPHSEQIWLVGSQRLITTNSLPYSTDLASQNTLNCRHPWRLIALESLRFFIIPDTFKSSKMMAWFSLTTLVDSLCRKS